MSPEKITSISAVFLALIALAVAIYETRVTREYQELSVWPSLSVYSTSIAKIDDRDVPVAFYLKNSGIGPAIVKDIKYMYKKQEFEGMHELLVHIKPDAFNEHIRTDKAVIKVILPGEEKLLYGNFVDRSEANLYFQKLHRSDDLENLLLDIRVCYCSLYNKCWELYGLNETRAISQCD